MLWRRPKCPLGPSSFPVLKNRTGIEVVRVGSFPSCLPAPLKVKFLVCWMGALPQCSISLGKLLPDTRCCGVWRGCSTEGVTGTGPDHPCSAASFPQDEAAWICHPALNHTRQDLKRRKILKKLAEPCPHLWPRGTEQGSNAALCACSQPGEQTGLLSPPGLPGCLQGLALQSLCHTSSSSRGALLPRLHSATWQQVEIPQTGQSQGLSGTQGCRSSASTLPSAC